jgi:hypothetical protein
MQQTLNEYSRRLTHKQRIKQKLLQKGFISNMELHLFSHCPTARIAELRREGLNITSMKQDNRQGFGLVRDTNQEVKRS